MAQPVAEADALCDRAHVGAPRAPAVEAQRQPDVLRDRQRRHQVERLEHEADALAAQDRQAALAELAQIDVAERNRARRRPVEAGRDVQERALARIPTGP